MTEAEMDLEDFESATLRYGAKVDRWPEPDRARALALMRDNPAASALLDDLATAEAAVLALRPPPEGTGDTARRIVETVMRRDAAPVRRIGWAEGALIAVSVALCGFAGFLSGDYIARTQAFASYFGTLAPLDLFLLIS